MAKKRKGNPVNGWVILDKPAGLGSTTAVSIVKRLFNAQKAGHAGTLDPAATGILPVALGEATKTISYVMDGSKIYRFRVQFGAATDTDDADGTVTETCEKRPSKDEILGIIPSFVGEIDQVPPQYSAIKINGKRAYDLARANQTADISARKVRIDDLRMTAFDSDNGFAEFEVACGKGTYVRSLARDMAEKLGSLGYVTMLRRVKCGKFSEGDAISLEYLRSQAHILNQTNVLMPVETVLDDILALALDAAQAQKLSNGGFLPVSDFAVPLRDGQVAQALTNGRLLALVRVQDGMIRPARLILQ